ncbi:hypothetical protein [Sphingomonas sp. LHG3443-2]|uniref:hypothetical protein n=1 Tax=Sphingomonas sp. LHG3443-2 TaxID=2804639 RepID=UPI003CF3A9B6
MSQLEICAFFCEDARQEIGGKPMFLGVLSSVVMVDEFPMSGDLTYVSLFYVPSSISEFEAQLDITVENDGDRQQIFSSKKKLKKVNSDDLDDWVCTSTFDLDHLELAENALLEARVSANGVRSIRRLRVRKTYEEEFEVEVVRG